MARPPVLIGEAPGRVGDPSRPLGGRSGRLLCQLAGWQEDGADPHVLLAARFYVINLLLEYPGHNGKGTLWPRSAARAAARDLRSVLEGRSAAVVLGRRVGDAFRVGSTPYGRWESPTAELPCPFVVLPHPSGINRAYNTLAVRRLTGAALRKASGEET